MLRLFGSLSIAAGILRASSTVASVAEDFSPPRGKEAAHSLRPWWDGDRGDDDVSCLLQVAKDSGSGSGSGSGSLLSGDDRFRAFPAPAPPAESMLSGNSPADQFLVPDPIQEDAAISMSGRSEVCVFPQDLQQTLDETVSEVLTEGLPRWRDSKIPATLPDVRIAFLIQAAFEEQLLLLKRTFSHIYSPKDTFLYLVDHRQLHPSRVRAMLPSPLPANVNVKTALHADYFYWPRVQVLLDGYKDLLNQTQPWDFVIHLSESDYPLHRIDWIRESLAMQRRRDFINVIPKCTLSSKGDVQRSPDWYWWSQNDAVASCGPATTARPVIGVHFPIERLEEHGLVFGKASEWHFLTRELVEYAVSPQLAPFRRLMSMHAAADEIFWSTLVLNIPGFTHEIGDQSTFEYWSGMPGSSGHSPMTLTESDEETIVSHRPRNFFARKVNRVQSFRLLSYIDVILAANDDPPTPSEVIMKDAIPCPDRY